ncbi:MAG: DUF1292 domain-containing protein [Lachnospiraceae bacterium]|nr:DUF1292 domain-containing protein [Lachnospiraceae bacterium]MDE6982054.1 DUF1292 domain-containing protein [Lachnospiraceae bacterium]
MEKIKFTDPDTGEEILFFCLEQTKMNGVTYLLVTEDEEGDTEAYILKEMTQEEEDATYAMVEDEVELNAVGKIFAELMDDVEFEI